MKTYKELLESLKEDMTVHHFTVDQIEHGSLNRDKIEKMAKGRLIKSTPLSDFKGHLLSKDYKD